jgi:hypothetical protein
MQIIGTKWSIAQGVRQVYLTDNVGKVTYTFGVTDKGHLLCHDSDGEEVLGVLAGVLPKYIMTKVLRLLSQLIAKGRG